MQNHFSELIDTRKGLKEQIAYKNEMYLQIYTKKT